MHIFHVDNSTPSICNDLSSQLAKGCFQYAPICSNHISSAKFGSLRVLEQETHCSSANNLRLRSRPMVFVAHVRNRTSMCLPVPCSFEEKCLWNPLALFGHNMTYDILWLCWNMLTPGNFVNRITNLPEWSLVDDFHHVKSLESQDFRSEKHAALLQQLLQGPWAKPAWPSLCASPAAPSGEMTGIAASMRFESLQLELL